MRDPWTEAMLAGDFAGAWRICDAVLERRRGRSCRHLPHHLRWVWDGSPLSGRRVLVRCYHGLGDTLQFIRFVPRLEAWGCRVVVEVQPGLMSLAKALPGAARFYPLDSDLPAWDVDIESMELPHALRLTVDDLPGPVPYLSAPAASRRLLGREQGTRLRVGLAWRAGDWRRERSIPAGLLRKIADLPLDLVSLQLGAGWQEAEECGLVTRFVSRIVGDFTLRDTAGVIAGLDLVVTVDTMIAHLAGALAVPVWTLLDADADWRWMRNRRDSPWYPTMQLFRQPAPGEWAEVIDEVSQALASPAEAVAQCERRPVRKIGVMLGHFSPNV